MEVRDKPLAWIDAQLMRLGCREILVVLAEPDGQVMFAWRGEPLTRHAGEARGAFESLHPHAGDQKVWEALGATSAVAR